MRDRLIELLIDTLSEWECEVRPETVSEIAEHLLENGVIVPPCKVGDTVYRQRKNGQALKKYENVSLEWIVAHLQEFGILIFLSPDDWTKKAEQALKERASDEKS